MSGTRLSEQAQQAPPGKARGSGVLYFGAPNRAFVVLHALEKRTRKLPERDITLSEDRMKRYLEQLENE